VRVLLVEDDDRVASALTPALTRRGLAIKRLASGAGVLDRVHEVDVVLLDLRMPDIDGLEVLERMRDLDPPPQCKVLIVSASLDELVERAAREAGAAGCVSKDDGWSSGSTTAFRPITSSRGRHGRRGAAIRR